MEKPISEAAWVASAPLPWEPITGRQVAATSAPPRVLSERHVLPPVPQSSPIQDLSASGKAFPLLGRFLEEFHQELLTKDHFKASVKPYFYFVFSLT